MRLFLLPPAPYDTHASADALRSAGLRGPPIPSNLASKGKQGGPEAQLAPWGSPSEGKLNARSGHRRCRARVWGGMMRFPALRQPR